MKITVPVLLCVAAAAAISVVFDAELDDEWQSFKSTYEKQYTETEEPMRRLIWEQNVRSIKKHNLDADMGKHSYWRGVNKFTDMASDEFHRTMLGAHFDAASESREQGMAWVAPSNVALPDTVDWRTQGYVTPVKDQGQCGSSPYFSAVEALEGQHFKKTGELASLSVQQILDCSRKFGNQGCSGGYMDQSFAYIRANKGVETDADYPYTANDGKCKFDATKVAATCTGFVDLPVGDENALKTAVATIGPISMAIDASHEGFIDYKSGIYNEPNCSSTNIDHPMAIVGYGTMQNQDYWLVKNTFGTSWGVQGYIYLSRNKNNQCGVATLASYPTV